MIHIEFHVTRLKVKVIMTYNKTIISSTVAMNVYNVKTSYFIFQSKMKRGNYMSNFGSKGQR